MTRTHVVSFGTPEYKNTLEVARHTALLTGGAHQVHLWDRQGVASFAAAHPHLQALPNRGHLFFAWKAYVILETLRRHVADGDVLVYVDATVEVVSPLSAYSDALCASGKEVMLFRLGRAEAENYVNWLWTKKATFDLMGCDSPAYRDAYQVNAAVQVYRKGPRASAFLREYLRYCTMPFCVDESCADGNPPGFRQHRHDQSVLSLLAVRHAGEVLLARDPTQWGNEDACPSSLRLPQLLDHHRRIYGSLVRVAVITPTVGTRFLDRCIESVQAQAMPCVDHYVVCDGPEHQDAVRRVVARHAHKRPIHVLVLPVPTGRDGWNGHRVYAALPHLCPDAHYVSFLDEDNWFEPDHLLRMMRLVKRHGLDASFALRNVVDAEGAFVCQDNCESLGNMCPSVLADDDFFVDTSCWLVSRQAAIRVSEAWHVPARPGEGQAEADRAVSSALFRGYRVQGVQAHSVNYTAGNSDRSVKPGFFLRGNDVMRYAFSSRPNLYLFHFDPSATAAFLHRLHKTDRSYALDEWQMTLARGLAADFNLLDGFLLRDHIPPGAVCLAHMCHPQALPLDTVFARSDLFRVCFTLEGPNIRHQAQWRRAFLEAHFDHLLTYWEPLLRDNPRATFCPHNTHHLDWTNPLDRGLLVRRNRGKGRSVCMVLERRELSGTYEIDGERLTCLDPWRERIATRVAEAADMTVFGRGWEAVQGVKVGGTVGKAADHRSSVEIMSGFTFAVVIENCDADGYVSEKIYDAFMAGAIPLYLGNNNARVAIPRDMYVDLREHLEPGALQTFLDALTDRDVAEFRRRIVAGREAVLQRVSVQSYRDTVIDVLEKGV